jgi:hypothetical protein
VSTFTAHQTFGSGITLSGTTHTIRVAQMTTAQRDALVSPDNGMIIYNTTTGVLNQYVSGAWTDMASGTTVNATEQAAGKAEAADCLEIANLDQTGATALVFVTPRCLVEQGSHTGSTAANRIPILNASGVMPLSLGGTGTGGKLATGALLVTQGSYTAPKALYATDRNSTVYSNDGRNWLTGHPSLPPTTLSGSAVLNSYTVDGTLTGSLLSYQIAANNPSAGTTYTLLLTGTGSDGAGGNGRLMLDVGTVAAPSGSAHFNLLASATSTTVYGFSTRISITFLTIGSSAKYIVRYETSGLNGTSTDVTSVVKTLDSTAAFILKITYNNGGNGAAGKAYPFIIDKTN